DAGEAEDEGETEYVPPAQEEEEEEEDIEGDDTAGGRSRAAKSATFHQCPICTRSFKKESRLRDHMTTHTGVRPYPCTHPGCDKAYKRQAHLTRHIRSAHSKDKPYACPSC
ncbi:hypothetical protein KIPB_017351, partial [Kipferlia bialata]